MALFCKQCSVSLFGFDAGDLAGSITINQARAGLVGTGICEGCAGGEFDHDGTCLGDCMEPTHNDKEYVSRMTPEALAEYNQRMDDLS